MSASRVFGIDISQVQGKIDWKKVADYAADVGGRTAYVWVKTTEGGSFVDPRQEANLKGARDAGLLAGTYHFARPQGDVIRQLEHHYKTSNAWGARDGELPPMLDLESMGGMHGQHVWEWACTWLYLAQQYYGKTPVLYTGAYFLEGLGRSTTDLSAIASFPLWLAQYPIDPIKSPAKAKTFEPRPDATPRLPKGLRDWKLWQYAGNGSKPVAGIGVHVDRNVFNGTLDELKSLARGGIGYGPADPQHVVNTGDTKR